MPQLKKVPSPNFSSRNAAPVIMLVLHYTDTLTAKDALDILLSKEKQVSSHYVVDEDGTAYSLVDEANCAWHAGVSYWRGNRNINNISVGIEIVNPGHKFGCRPFPKAQMEAVAELCSGIITRHPIKPVNIVGHSDVAPLRKLDPGEYFDWKWLADRGIGIWPVIQNSNSHEHVQEQKAVTRRREGISISGRGEASLVNNLMAYGYDEPSDDAALKKTIEAFQRHFRQSQVDGVWDAECEQLLAALLKMI